MNVRAIAIDIDGTLTDEKRRFDLKAIEKLREVEALGVPVILATGNVLCVAESAAVFAGTSGCLIAENGGVIKSANEVFYLGDRREAERAYDFLSKKMKVRKVNMSELRRTEIAIYRDVKPDEVRRLLMDFKVEVVDTKFAIHIKSPDVSKGKALLRVAEIMKIGPEDIVAIGDSENDRGMLETAGYGISIGEEKLRDVSDFTTKYPFGRGAVEALEHVISKKIYKP